MNSRFQYLGAIQLTLNLKEQKGQRKQQKEFIFQGGSGKYVFGQYISHICREHMYLEYNIAKMVVERGLEVVLTNIPKKHFCQTFFPNIP